MRNAQSSEMAALLPRLLRFSFVLGGNRSAAERVVEAACRRAGSEPAQGNAEPRLDRRMFSIVYEIWASPRQGGAFIPDDAPERRKQTEDVNASYHKSRTPLERIRRQTAGLTIAERAALALVVIDGRSYSEAAAILSLEVQVLSALLYSARMQLVEMT